MSKRLILILALAFVVGITCAAYAEVQNVKVSGDINFLAVARNQFDLTKGTDGNKYDDHESFFATQTRVRVDADLTDNVSATVRLINERNWNTETNTNTDIDLDLAYVSLKEFLYSPLSLTVGRQEMRFGNALIIGNAGTYAAGSSDSVLNGVPSDLSVRKAFDAIRATLNYDPLVVDVFYAKIDENYTRYGSANDDVNLYGVYATYAVNSKLSVDLYGLYKDDSNSDKNNRVGTVGTLLKYSPITDLNTSLEGAFQFGNNRGDGNDKRKAFAVQALADYTFSNVKFTPNLGLGYTYLSGDSGTSTSSRGSDEWDPLYYDQALNNITYALIPFSNLSVINVKGSIKPLDDVTLLANYGYYRRAKGNSNNMLSAGYDGDNYYYSGSDGYEMTNKKDLGNAIDLSVIYDYTEDVQLGLTLGYFKPGEAFAENNRRDATQVIGTMKVTF